MVEQFATVNARTVCWEAMIHLAYDRRMAEINKRPIPSGLGRTIRGKQVQVDLV
jgi:hypothetical protein